MRSFVPGPRKDLGGHEFMNQKLTLPGVTKKFSSLKDHQGVIIIMPIFKLLFLVGR